MNRRNFIQRSVFGLGSVVGLGLFSKAVDAGPVGTGHEFVKAPVKNTSICTVERLTSANADFTVCNYETIPVSSLKKGDVYRLREADGTLINPTYPDRVVLSNAHLKWNEIWSVEYEASAPPFSRAMTLEPRGYNELLSACNAG